MMYIVEMINFKVSFSDTFLCINSDRGDIYIYYYEEDDYSISDVVEVASILNNLDFKAHRCIIRFDTYYNVSVKIKKLSVDSIKISIYDDENKEIFTIEGKYIKAKEEEE